MPTPIDILQNYFSTPYNGHIFIFTNKVTLADIQQYSFTEILSHNRAVDENGNSIAMRTFEAIIAQTHGLKDKKVLDIGGNTGYFSFLAVEAGANVVMIERLERQATVAKAIAEIKNYKIQIFNSSIQTYLDSSNEHFNYAFMFNSFDQMLRENEETAWIILKKVSERAETLFLMIGPTEQLPQTKGLATSTPVKCNPVISKFDKPDFEVILEKTNYSNCAILLENANNGRQLQAYW